MPGRPLSPHQPRPAWRDPAEYRALAFVLGAAFPRLAYRMRWPTRLGPRGLILYIAANTLLGFALRQFAVPAFRRMGETRERAIATLTAQLGARLTRPGSPSTTATYSRLGGAADGYSQRMNRALLPLLAAISLVVLIVPAAPAQTPVPEERIRPAVTVSGVDVGNLTLAEAKLRLEQTLGPVFAGDVVVNAAGQPFALHMKNLGFRFRADNTALRALHAGQAAPPAADGTLPPASAEPAVSYGRKPVWSFARAIAKTVGRAPRNATIRITLKRMIERSGRPGRGIGVKPLVAAIQATLANPRAPRALAPPLVTLQPKVRRKDLAKAYPVVITIDRAHFTLRLFKRLRQVRHYGVAVGQPAYPTPAGLFSISSKQVNPTWTAPNSPWAGELAGQQVSGSDPTNPLKARWMGIADGVGIHGTGQDWTVGTRASHGCIRMHVSDVIGLYRHVPVGTPVLIG